MWSPHYPGMLPCQWVAFMIAPVYDSEDLSSSESDSEPVRLSLRLTNLRRLDQPNTKRRSHIGDRNATSDRDSDILRVARAATRMAAWHCRAV